MPKSSSSERRIIELWLGLRLFTMFWALLIAPLRPITEREQAIGAWPPSQPYLTWLERVLFAPWQRWDVHIFVEAVRDGFNSENGTSSFHPLLPLLAKPFVVLFGEPVVGLWLVSSVASLAAVIAIYRLARLDLPEPAAAIACVTLISFPISAILFAPYTEPLWIACAALSMLWARQRRWAIAAVAAACAALTRQQGLFLSLPLACEMWNTRDRRGIIAVLAAPTAYLGWLLYRGLVLSDAHLDFSSAHSLIYSTLLSPSSSKVVPVQTMMPPWEALYHAIQISFSYPRFNNILNLGFAGLFVFMTALAWRNMRGSYRLLSATIILASFAYYTGPAMPYMGLPRHLLLAFPVFIGLAPALQTGRRSFLVATLFLPSMLFVVFVYILEAWVP
jgi:hypothetical protein